MASSNEMQTEMATHRERPNSISRTSIVYHRDTLETALSPKLSNSAESDYKSPVSMVSPMSPPNLSPDSSTPMNREEHHQSISAVSEHMEDAAALPDRGKNSRFEWHSISVSVGNGDDAVQILRDQHGSVLSGELFAVMGGSGAGKSTLLDALSGRSNLHQLQIEGELAINGRKMTVKKQRLIQSLCAFVPQTDILCPTQTVEEALWFYAKLKLHQKSKEEQRARIEHLIDVLHLTDCRHSRIGDDQKV